MALNHSAHPSDQPPRRVAVLGSTGSIGRSALEVIAASGGHLRCVALSAHSRTESLLEQARRFRPRWVVLTDSQKATDEFRRRLPPGTQLLCGQEGVAEVVRHAQVDVVLVAVVGAAGLLGTWEAVQAGKTVALANKESLVAAGGLLSAAAKKTGAQVLPVDSEHSGLFQALQSGRRDEVERLVLTASGGPFLNTPLEHLPQVTVEEALQHPTWQMGRKITVDSATMMNKALEVIEARWLFDLPPEQIQVMIHPQSMIHALVEFADGSVLAQVSPPDMKLPIQYALYYPRRVPGVAERMDWTRRWHWELFPPDPERFPALELGHQVAARGGTAGAVLNAANEVAVERFLQGEIRFTDIVPLCRAVLESHAFQPQVDLDTILRLDRWAREEARRWKP